MAQRVERALRGRHGKAWWTGYSVVGMAQRVGVERALRGRHGKAWWTGHSVVDKAYRDGHSVVDRE